MENFMKKVIGERKKETLETKIVSIQKGEERLRNIVIKEYEPFVLKVIHEVKKKYINKSDDEFSVGIIAFNEAIEKFSYEKSPNFLSFAKLIIKRRIIDYIRKENKQINSFSLDIKEEEMENESEIIYAIEEYKEKDKTEQRKEEIVHYIERLQDFGLTLEELTKESPKHKDARENMIRVAKVISSDVSLLKELLEKKRLPLKELEKKTEVSRKTLERNRKYIISIVLIEISDYLFLKDYLKIGGVDNG